MRFQHPAFAFSPSHDCWFRHHTCVDDFLALLSICLYRWAFPLIMFLFLVVAFYFPLREVPLVFGAKLVSLVLYSLSFCLLVKLLISLWNLKDGCLKSSWPWPAHWCWGVCFLLFGCLAWGVLALVPIYRLWDEARFWGEMMASRRVHASEYSSEV